MKKQTELYGKGFAMKEADAEQWSRTLKMHYPNANVVTVLPKGRGFHVVCSNGIFTLQSFLRKNTIHRKS